MNLGVQVAQGSWHCRLPARCQVHHLLRIGSQLAACALTGDSLPARVDSAGAGVVAELVLELLLASGHTVWH